MLEKTGFFFNSSTQKYIWKPSKNAVKTTTHASIESFCNMVDVNMSNFCVVYDIQKTKIATSNNTF